MPTPVSNKFSKPVSYRIERHDVDQIFRDNNGYRVYWDNETGEVIEKKYFENGRDAVHPNNIPLPEIKELSQFKGLTQGDKHIKIYKDLEKRSQGYADIIYYTLSGTSILGQASYALGQGYCDKNDLLYYVEIHVSKNKELSPGNEAVPRGKSKIIIPMNEIK